MIDIFSIRTLSPGAYAGGGFGPERLPCRMAKPFDIAARDAPRDPCAGQTADVDAVILGNPAHDG